MCSPSVPDRHAVDRRPAAQSLEMAGGQRRFHTDAVGRTTQQQRRCQGGRSGRGIGAAGRVQGLG